MKIIPDPVLLLELQCALEETGALAKLQILPQVIGGLQGL